MVANRPVSLAPRPVFLAGREELLAELDARLGAEGGAVPQIMALCGLGGAGKTSVALEYAYRHLAEVGVAWQFPAEAPAVLAAGFGELAAQLGAREVLDARDPVATVHAVLAAHPADWLLVLDNAPDRASVARFVPSAGRGRVLITSQSGLWPPGQGLDVPVLATDVAAGFLVIRTGDPDEHAAVELAGELGGLPLALEQAAAYLQAAGGQTCSPGESPPATARRWRPPGRWRSSSCRGPTRWRSACSGCWHVWRLTRSRCGFCCSPGRSSPGGLGQTLLRYWRRCWTMS